MRSEPAPLRLRPLPRPARPTFERRRNRSDNAADALRLALTASMRRGALDCVLITDEEGMVVAKCETELDLDMLAAVTPIVGRGKAIPKIKRDGEPRELSVGTLEILDERLYIAVLGGSHRTRARELRGATAATRRILA